MKHLRIFEEFDDFDLDPITREIFDVWVYVPISKYSDEYRLRGNGNDLEKAKQIANDIRFTKDYYARVKFASEGDDNLTEDEIREMMHNTPKYIAGLKEIGYVLVNKNDKILAP